MTVVPPAKIATLVVDESISRAQLSACKKWLKKHGCAYEQLLFIAERHPGMPDHRIIKTLLTNEIVASRLVDMRERFSPEPDREIEIPAPVSAPLINPNTDRGALLLAAKWFVDRAKKLESVKQIALVGSICTNKKNPKDIDILLTIATDSDIAPLSKLKRQMQGRTQRGLLGADVFLVEEGQYIGRPCRFRDPHPRVACAHDGLRCNLDRAFLCDTSAAFKLKNELLTSPPIILYPEFQAKISVPADVLAGFDLSDD